MTTSPPSAPAPTSEPTGAKRWIAPLLVLLAFLALQTLRQREDARPEIAYSSFYALVDAGDVERVTISGPTVTGALKKEQQVEGKVVHQFSAQLPAQEDHDLLPLLRGKGVAVVAKSDEPPLLVKALISLLPWALLLGGWVWLSRRAQSAMGPGGMLGGVVQGRPRRFSEEREVRVRFDDVAGLGASKRDLQEVVAFLREPERFKKLGARIPRGVLLVGPPGTGKTLLARAVAGEANVPFFSVNGSEFIELFVGVGAARVRELFAAAKKEAPAIIFIDEIDAVGRARGTGLGGGHDEREQTLNQLLSEMDGFSRNDLTIVLAATNRPDVLDSALLRPGRFDRRVVLDRPERAARRAILEVHTRGKPLAPDVNLDEIAAATPGFAGADLANLVNEAALAATRRGATAIALADFRQAEDKIVVGDPREGPLTPDERRRVAIHEAGHALVAHLSAATEPVKRVSILPRGMALGATTQLPGEDRHLATQSELTARLAVLLGGYSAEKLVCGEVSTGAENDLKQATAIAYDMVTRYGMSEAIGPVFYEHHAEHPFLGNRLATDSGVAEPTSRELDVEARRLLMAAAQAARGLLEANRHRLDRLIAALIEHETVEREELTALLDEPRPAPQLGPPALVA